MKFRERLRRGAGAFVVDGAFSTASWVGRLHPRANPARHGVEVIRDIPYLPSGHQGHLLDVYRPKHRSGKLPVVFYVHGGGFRILSKDTHWIMALAFARRGYLVVNISYRLAPRHPFPAAIADSCAALVWAVRNVDRYGGDPERMVIAGESAGANLATSLAITACFEREERYARQVFETGLAPRAVVPACGLLQVTDPERFRRRRHLPSYIFDRIAEVRDAYLGPAKDVGPRELDLADPLLVLERGDRPARPLPPFFTAAGTADPILDDTRRLKQALDRQGVICEAHFFEREIHAFHAFLPRANARRYWQELYRFLGTHVPHVPSASTESY